MKRKILLSPLIIAILIIVAGVGMAGAAILIGNSGDNSPSTAIDLQKGLVGWWKLDGDAKDATPYASHLTNNNGVTFTVDRKGQVAKAGWFVRASSQYLSVADNSTLSTGDIDFTASGWVYFDSFSTFVNIFGKWNTTGDQREWLLYWDNAAGKFHFAVSSAGTVQQGDVTADSAGTISAGQWYFVVVWHNSVNNNTNIQVNNGTVTTTSYSSGVFNSTADFQISGVNGSVNPFDGRVDDMRFYKKVLTSEERTALYESYNAGVVVSDLQKGLVGQWKLNGDAKDSTPNANNGTVTGATLTTDRKGTANKAYSFNGTSDYVSVADSSSNSIVGDITVSAWIQLTTNNAAHGIASRWTNTSNQRAWQFLVNSTGKLLFSISNDGIVDAQNITGNTTLSTATWYHVLATFVSSSKQATVYLNGTSDGATTLASSGIYDPNRSLIIGAREIDAGVFDLLMYGSMDDVRLYNRALSATEVTALYEEYDPGIVVSDLSKGLVGQWSFDGDAKDRTPYANNGTVTGAVALTSDRKGQINKAYNFLGETNDYIKVLHNTALSLNSTFTISLWFYANSPPSANFLGKRTATDAKNYQLNLGGVTAHKLTASIGETGSFTTIAGGTTIDNAVWHHLVFTKSVGQLNLYVDGVIDATPVAETTTAITSTADLYFGQDGINSGRLVGKLDDVRIYNRALTATEVLALYESY